MSVEPGACQPERKPAFWAPGHIPSSAGHGDSSCCGPSACRSQIPLISPLWPQCTPPQLALHRISLLNHISRGWWTLCTNHMPFADGAHSVARRGPRRTRHRVGPASHGLAAPLRAVRTVTGSWAGELQTRPLLPQGPPFLTGFLSREHWANSRPRPSAQCPLGLGISCAEGGACPAPPGSCAVCAFWPGGLPLSSCSQPVLGPPGCRGHLDGAEPCVCPGTYKPCGGPSASPHFS